MTDKESNQRLLVAEITNTKKIAGYCRFEKKDPQNMYISFILIDKDLCKQGIGKKLAYAAMHTFDGVTHCNFRALVHDAFINELYLKHGAIQKEQLSFDPNTGQICTDPNAPITHNMYSYEIKK